MKFSAWFTEKKRQLPKPLRISQANEASLKRQRPVLALTYEAGLGNGLTLLFFSSHDRRTRRVRQTRINPPRKRGRRILEILGAKLKRRKTVSNAMENAPFCAVVGLRW